jgi:hypothetical protein
MGSCGTAAFLKKPVISLDIASDPLRCVVAGTDYKNLALSYGLRAAWSYPLERAAEGYEQMSSGKVRFRVVLTM